MLSGEIDDRPHDLDQTQSRLKRAAFFMKEGASVLEKVNSSDVALGVGTATFPIWAQILTPWLQFILAVAGILYTTMRVYHEYLRIKQAKREAFASDQAQGGTR